MAMNQIVGHSLKALELPQASEELGDMLVQRLLRIAVRSGLQVDDAGSISKPDYLRVLGIVASSENVHLVAAPTEFPGELEDVHVHSTGVFFAQARHGTAVEA